MYTNKIETIHIFLFNSKKMALPLRVYALPPNVLALIKEYSRPLTRPDWRTKPVMPLSTFYKNILQYMNDIGFGPFNKKDKDIPVIINLLKFVLNRTGISRIKFLMNVYGPTYIIDVYGIDPQIVHTLNSICYMYKRI